jgi:hypothetical protein
LLAPFCCVLAAPPWRGIVRDAAGGEPLAQARAILRCGEAESEVRTNAEGRFELAGAAPGCALRVTLVGYRPLTLVLTEARELERVLTPDSLARRDSIDVAAGPFEVTQSASASERTLTGAELKNLAGVLMDDPLRAVQSLPGVASSNDYVAQFSVRGAPFARIGVYLDGVLLNSPFHTVQGQEDTGSLSIVNADLIDELALHAGAPPVAYQDRSAAALDLRLREGSRQAPSVRFNAGVASASILAEGPLTRAQRGSWLVAVRRSYLQYLLRRSSAADSMAFGFFDAQGKLAYDLTRRHNVSLSFFDGNSDLDRTPAQSTLGINAIMTATYHVSLAQAAWRYAPSSRLMLTNRAAYMRERADAANPRELPLGGSAHREWIWNTSLVWSWRANAPLQAGGSFRRIGDDGFSARYNFNPLAVRRRDGWSGTGLRGGGFVEQGWIRGPLTLTAGTRFDGFTLAGPPAISPHASAVLGVAPRTRLQLAWSQAVQYPALMPLLIQNMGDPRLLPERANHTIAALEQQLNDRTRIRAEIFYRADRDLITQPLLEPRMLANGQIFAPPLNPLYGNSVRGAARGVEVFLQRRTANRLSGWVSYAYARTWLRDGVTGAAYAADSEQRHTMNAYASYRLRPSVNLSARYTYGANFPIPGFLREGPNATYFLTTQRNQLRLPAYQRGDVRLNKSFQWQHWRGVLFVELLNFTNHANRAYDSFSGYNARTGQAFPNFTKLFPIVPAAGVMLEWNGPPVRAGR